MHYKEISRLIGIYLLGFSPLLLIPFFLGCYYQFYANPSVHPQPHSTFSFLITFFISLALGGTCCYLGRKSKGVLYKKESIALVLIIWLLTPCIGALPFLISGTLSRPLQAFFESTSGFTTTGSTILQAKEYDQAGKEIPITQTFGDVYPIHYIYYGNIPPVKDPSTNAIVATGVEAVSKALLFWRSMIQWLGGVGIVVLFVAIAPSLGVSGKLIFQSEMTGPLKESIITPRVTQAAFQLWLIYAGLTLAETIFLIATNHQMPLLDAVTISFSTLSTGGFSIKNESIGFYQNQLTEWVIIVFMIFGGTNFTVFYHILRGRLYRIYKPELLLYLIFILLAGLLGSYLLLGIKTNLLDGTISEQFSIGEAIRHGFFQLVSAQTSTGFATVDYDRWPYAVQTLMLIVMFIGGMSGSTAGGIKVIRFLMFYYISKLKIESLVRSETIRQVKISGSEIGNETSITVLCFFLIAIVSSVAGTFLYILNGIDPITSLGLVGCMVNNVGLSFRVAGPTHSCAFMSDFSLLLSSFLMLLGRLEFFAILVILLPSFWKRSG